MLVTVQDLGRIGYGHLGVPRSGAADLTSHRLANRLVGNPESSACLEFTLGGGAIRFLRACGLAVTGAPVSLRLSGRPIAMDRWARAVAGDVLELGVPGYGLRTYVAVAGGIAVPAVLGSRSTDTLSGLGPPRLEVGVRLPVGREHTAPPAGPDVVVAPVPGGTEVTLRYRRGPRDDLFTAGALTRFETAAWQVTAQSDRVGARRVLAHHLAGKARDVERLGGDRRALEAEFFGGDYARIGRITAMFFVLGMVAILFAPDTSKKQLAD